MKLIKNLILSGAIMAAGCSVQPQNNYVLRKERYLDQNPVTKYAVVVVGSNRGEKGLSLSDPYDRNGFFLQSTYVYKYLEEMGFRHENIYYLYADGKPDFSEPLNHSVIERIRENEFNEPVQKKMATIRNLENILQNLSRKVDSNDVLMVSIATHGNPYEIEMYGKIFADSLTPSRLSRMMQKIKPGKGVLYIDACHSGAFIKKLNLDDYVVISSTGEYTYGWSDRDFAGSSMFFRSAFDPQSDMNIDGKITIREAFQRSSEQAKHHWNRIMKYLLTRYNWEGANPRDEVKSISVVPMMVVGKNASADTILFNLFHFSRKK
ncbi:hypothetical protein D6777_01630 [Candidatus Woesearchaeota archaeon]|nr:MAG: hypothetical protein D6777_01630 [Candidatus Woesearchaeota archaeon]